LSDYIAARIKKQRFFKVRSVGSGKDLKPRYVIGFDSEADTSSQGKPMLFQFSLPDTREDDVILRVVPEDKKHAGLRVFLDFLEEFCNDREVNYLIYVWNLTYELTQIFHDLPSEVRGAGHLIIDGITAKDGTRYDWKIEIINIKRQIVKFSKDKHITILVLDGKAFYNTSLDKAAKMLGRGEKHTLSENLSRSRFTRDDLDDPEFLLYARRDAHITRLIGDYITMQHRSFNIPSTVSAPHFASTVFKAHFLRGDLTNPPQHLEQAGLYSYHGGKNGFYLDGPGDFDGVYFYDITSAYPEAMHHLPDIESSGWRDLTKYRHNVHALYRVSGNYHPCKFRGLQNHNGSWASEGFIEDTWLTGYELDVLVEHNEIDLTDLTGYEMFGPSGGALQEYVNRFFSIKQNTTGPERETAKLLLNSLYGKFFQKQAVGSVGHFDFELREWIVTNPSSDFDYEAGGLYNPPIASLITGFVRARIHRLEHKYDAIMTSTDGLFGFNPPDPSDLGSNLGDLKSVMGRLRIWRERLYIFDGNDGDRKMALHGFRGNVDQLLDIPLARGSYIYEGKQMITLKMSTMQHNHMMFAPGTFVTLPYEIVI
jgi:hypothetical protein